MRPWTYGALLARATPMGGASTGGTADAGAQRGQERDIFWYKKRSRKKITNKHLRREKFLGLKTKSLKSEKNDGFFPLNFSFKNIFLQIEKFFF